MERDLSIFLKSIYNNKLKGNLFSWVLANFLSIEDLNKSKRELFEKLRTHYRNHLNKELTPFEISENSFEEITKRDFRINSIRLSQIRGIPAPKDSISYGIDFSDKDQPNISLIVGSNGSGKSSIYDALEFIYTNEIGESKLRDGKTKSDFANYLTHYNSKFSDASCIINTPSGNFSLTEPIFEEGSKIKDLINPSSHFISEYDIYENGQLNFEGLDDNSFHFFVAQSLGLDTFLKLNKQLSDIVDYIDRRRIEKDELESNENDLQTLEKNVSIWEEELKSKKKKVEKIDSKRNQGNVNENKSKTIDIINDSISLFDDTSLDSKSVENARDLFLNQFKDYKTTGPERGDSDLISFLNSGVEIIERQNLDDCPFCNSSRKDIQELKDDINQKLNQYKKDKQLIQSTEEAHDNFVLNLQSVVRQLKNTVDKIEKDISTISFINELTELINQEKDIKEKIITFLNSEIIEKFNELRSDYDFREKKFEELEKIIIKYSDNSFTSLSNLSEEIELFVTYRTKRLEEVKSQFVTEDNSGKESSKVLLKKDIQELQNSIESANSEIENKKEKIEDINDLLKLNDRIKKEAITVNKIVSTEINQEVQNVFNPLKETIEEILNDYMDADHYLEIIKSDQSEEGEVLSAVINKKMPDGNTIKITPSKYFNSFRFKLFCMLVSCSIAISSRKESGINIPIVFDDVFYSSDFETKSTVLDFLQNVISLTYKYTPKMPLQLVLLTHDELIFDLARDAISSFEIKNYAEPIEKVEEENDFWNDRLKNNSKYFRLFSPSDLNDKPKSSKYGDYWNLVYEIPARENFIEIDKVEN